MDWTQIVTSLISAAVVLIGYIIVDKREKNKQYDNFKTDVIETLNSHREEYLKGISDVKTEISDMKTAYQKSQTIIEIKIDNLEKKQDVHNGLISRMYAVESAQKLQEEQIKVANHRITDIEDKQK